jgi:hypothetical protein
VKKHFGSTAAPTVALQMVRDPEHHLTSELENDFVGILQANAAAFHDAKRNNNHKNNNRNGGGRGGGGGRR